MHIRLHAALAKAHALDSDLVGVQLDLSKCFDRILPAHAIRTWERLGCPGAITKLLRAFYEASSRHMEASRAVHHTPLYTTLSLLQGCPASRALLAGLMATWTHYVGVIGEDEHRRGGTNAPEKGRTHGGGPKRRRLRHKTKPKRVSKRRAGRAGHAQGLTEGQL